MTNTRWKLLMDCDDLNLTEQEIAQGWHFCNEFDGLLVGPGSYELHCCHCLPDGHPVYDTRPPQEPMPETYPDDLLGPDIRKIP
jgi:hypothetical protein